MDSVVALFHSSNVEPVSCIYTVDGYKNYQLSLSSKKESNLEINYSKPTNWIFSNPDNPSQGSCTPADKKSQSCPLKEQSALTFYNINIGGGVRVSIYGNIISSALSSQYGKVNYDTALNYCKGTKECRIDIEDSQGVFYGDVIVDMYNNMKILTVRSLTPLANISQIGGYNVIEVGYSYQK